MSPIRRRARACQRGSLKQKHRVVGRKKPEPPPVLEICLAGRLEQLEERASRLSHARDALGLALAHSPGVYSA